MKFEEALELLKQGKKVKRRKWENGVELYLKNNDFWFIRKDIIMPTGLPYNDISGLPYEDVVANDWEEYKEPVLTVEEKEYLKMIIKYYPFEISKVSLEYDDEYAYEKFIKLHNSAGFDETIYVKSGSFMSLELEKEYTLEELGLKD